MEHGVLDVSVIIPVRNAEEFLEECLASVARSRPREIIVVDGNSSDATLVIARRYTTRILSDGGRGLPVARLLGAQGASCRRVLLLDADVVLPDGALAALLDEFESGGYRALQAGLHSVSNGRYWGEALAAHHRTGRSKDWFGLVATVFDRQAILEHGFDARFLSGEDIELRWRLEQSGQKIGVSRRTVVTHRFCDGSFAFARGQWRADGLGLGRMVRKHGWRGMWLLLLPTLAGLRGLAVSLPRREPRWIPYYACYAGFNYASMVRGLLEPPTAAAA
jgi:glycosyltransferase involved in cell wall biosynthesis